MAALPLSLPTVPAPPPAVQTSRRSKVGRSRPNLTKLCQKTKMCSFHLRGMCTREESCTFAHDEKEIQAKPDLGCTKLCPALVSEGHCPQMDCCKFAHNEADLRKLDFEELDTPPIQAVSSRSCAPTGAEEQEVTSVGASGAHVGSHTSVMTGQLPRTAPQVVSRLNDAAVSGALTLGGMIFHLTRIFVSLYQARPEVADRIGVPAHVLAKATAEETWADAGLDGNSLLSFKDFSRLCALPSELIARDVPPSGSARSEISRPQVKSDKVGPRCDDFSRGTITRSDSDSWSQCSTDDESSNLSMRTISGCLTPASCEDLEEAWVEPEMKVMNTFIHFSTPSIVRTRRAQSLPCRSRAA